MPHGIDVYTAYQTVRDWHAVRGAGYEWCYLKMSDGNSTRSEGGYTAGGHSAGMAMGGYHYAQFGDARRQADLFLDRCEYFRATDLAPALDLEHPFTANSTAVNFARDFLRRVVERGHRPAVYANNSMASYVVPKLIGEFPGLIRWVARYSSNDNGSNKVRPSLTYDVHQYSQYGHVPGISASSVDLNDGIIPHNHGGASAPGGIETMAFDSRYTDWAGNPQDVQSWMNHVDQRVYRIEQTVDAINVDLGKVWASTSGDEESGTNYPQVTAGAGLTEVVRRTRSIDRDNGKVWDATQTVTNGDAQADMYARLHTVETLLAKLAGHLLPAEELPVVEEKSS